MGTDIDKLRKRILEDEDGSMRRKKAKHQVEIREHAIDPEPAIDPEAAGRTVFVFQIPLEAGDKDIFNFFSGAGKIRDIRLFTDSRIGCYTKFGYVEFADVSSVPGGMALCGRRLLGRPLMVKSFPVEFTATAPGGAQHMSTWRDRLLYVRNLPDKLTEAQLRSVFEPLGPLELVQMPIDYATKNGLGYALIQFALHEDVASTLKLDEKLLLPSEILIHEARDLHLPPVSSIQDTGDPSEFLLLSNFFDPNAEGNQNLEQEFKNLVNSKFGSLRHIYVDKDSDGRTYLQFYSDDPAIGFQREFLCRWGGDPLKMTTVSFNNPRGL